MVLMFNGHEVIRLMSIAECATELQQSKVEKQMKIASTPSLWLD
jgi:hypothetical protein